LNSWINKNKDRPQLTSSGWQTIKKWQCETAQLFYWFIDDDQARCAWLERDYAYLN
jgi:hypothetical protein